ncbi:hypothetical protein DENIS_4390 [Desulfonema ishimotonii]|uniref:HEAT repeat domain-containing protein n=1 Tax=Desulfonema ishimotonii TaxID=45657 RepID=A0A401G2F3_9BACT|nr:HEAT repeat domain-containing protein [Desulfonema ishimotonii]GBC63396.1 hypothetical protein DENIS_4390 [Desulfonema ishimotonii]
MGNRSRSDIHPAPPRPAGNDIQQATAVLTALEVAAKNFRLYPETHAVCQQGLHALVRHLNTFLNRNGALRFYLEGSRAVFRGKPLRQTGDGSLTALLSRDGIRWLEFRKGLTTDEIRIFLDILKRCRILSPESEGDIVTALWQENFSHICYEAVDVFWEIDPEAELPALLDRNRKFPLPDTGPDEQKLPPRIGDLSPDGELWRLTPTDLREIGQMVIREENWDSTADVLDLMTIILEKQRHQDDFGIILEFIAEEFQATLEQGEFDLALCLLRRLHRIRRLYGNRSAWAVPMLEHFFSLISTPPYLGVFGQANLELLDDNQLRIIRTLLCLLPPEAIRTLAPMLAETPSPRIGKLLGEVIGTLACRDMAPLEEMLACPHERVVYKLTHILGHISGEKSDALLVRLLDHPAEAIRIRAIKILLTRGRQPVAKLFYLMESPHAAVRRMVLKCLEQKRNPSAERLLLKYMTGTGLQRADSAHILACFTALGKCGSSACIPFLRQMLLGQWWHHYLGKDSPMERQGAALALMALEETEESVEILEKAARSPFPNIRAAYRKARQGVR